MSDFIQLYLQKPINTMVKKNKTQLSYQNKKKMGVVEKEKKEKDSGIQTGEQGLLHMIHTIALATYPITKKPTSKYLFTIYFTYHATVTLILY